MPQMPESQLDPRIDDLPEGTRLEIIEIGKDEKTTKGYDKLTVVLVDGSEIVGMGVQVRGPLIQARDDPEFIFSKEDPVTCKVEKYQANGRTCTKLVPA